MQIQNQNSRVPAYKERNQRGLSGRLSGSPVLQAGPQAPDTGKLWKEMWRGLRPETVNHSCPDHLTLLERRERCLLGILLLPTAQRMQAAWMISPPTQPTRQQSLQLSQQSLPKNKQPGNHSQMLLTLCQLLTHLSVHILLCFKPLVHLSPAPCASQKPHEVKIIISLTSLGREGP